MQVVGIGNVTECNKHYIFLNNEGKQDRIKADKEKLEGILSTATENEKFYGRMWEEVSALHERRLEQVKRKYHYITDEMIKEAFDRDHKEGLNLSWSKDSNNERYMEQINKAFGIYEGAKYASVCRWEAHKLKEQAKNALGLKD